MLLSYPSENAKIWELLEERERKVGSNLEHSRASPSVVIRGSYDGDC